MHFKTQPALLNNSNQPTHGPNQNIQITPQQLVNILRQLNSQNTQLTTNAPTPYYLQAALTQTPSPVIRRNAFMMYPYSGGSVPMQQSLRPFDGTDPTYTTEDFLNAIKTNMVLTAGPEQTDSPFHEAWYSHLPLDIKKNWQAFCREFQKTFDNQQSQTQAKLLLESITRTSNTNK